jgi:diguanylate cyclase (GGDEF)-like protein
VLASRTIWIVGLLIVGAHAAYTVFGIGRGHWDWLVSMWTPAVVFTICTAVVACRALPRRRDRLAWLCLAVGMALYAVASIALAAGEDPNVFPAVSDFFSWALYPFALATIWLLARVQRGSVRGDLWLDGVIGGLAVAAAGVVVVFLLVIGPLQSLAGASGNVVYVAADLLILGFAIGSCALLGWRPSPALVAVILAFVALGIDDTLYLSAIVRGTFTPAGALDSYWMFSLLLIAGAAAWSPAVVRLDDRVTIRSAVAIPFVFAPVAVILAGYQALIPKNNLFAVALTMLTLLAVVVRLAFTVRAHLSMIEANERDALTDALTGLGNRRKLLRDADELFDGATDERPVLFGMFDLDGLKKYNDSYGHPAGDALLLRLGARLERAVAPDGRAYRIGGDEFCILVAGDAAQCHSKLADATEALSDDGESSTIGSCCGSVLIPSEAIDAGEAMRRADRRLYAAKSNRPG